MTNYFLYDIPRLMNNLLKAFLLCSLFYSVSFVCAAEINSSPAQNEVQKKLRESELTSSQDDTYVQQIENIKPSNQQKTTILHHSAQTTDSSTAFSTQDPRKQNMNPNHPQNILSDSFAPVTSAHTQKPSFFNNLSEDISWFFQKKKTKHKIGLLPIPSFNLTSNFSISLRFFIYSSHHKGYYLSFSASKYVFRPFLRFRASYRGYHHGNFRTKSSLVYDNHYENFYGAISKEGMNARKEDSIKLHANRFMFDYNLLYQIPNENFYGGLGAQVFFRKEKPQQKKAFDDELFLLFKALTGYDSRDNWRDPKTGAFHQITLACKPPWDEKRGYCKGEGDFRLYLSLFKKTSFYYGLKNSVLALRAFAGSSIFSPSSYSLVYSLGGQDFFQNLNSLRGFRHNRFRGDKIYFAQTELRFPIWKKYIDGVVFAELGEVANYEKSFDGFVIDYGGGLRFGLPPNYDLKIRFDFGAGLDRQNEMNYNFIMNFLHVF